MKGKLRSFPFLIVYISSIVDGKLVTSAKKHKGLCFVWLLILDKLNTPTTLIKKQIKNSHLFDINFS